MATQPANIYRFGVFEVDLRSGELHKRGVKIKIQEQPLQVLVMLLAEPGAVVTREQLRSRLWPTDTFVDFEHGINAAVKKLRQVLSDEAENPRFIETLPRRGYRFIGPVESPSKATPAVETRKSIRPGAYKLALALLMVALLGGTAWFYFSHRVESNLLPSRVVPLTSLSDRAECASSIAPGGDHQKRTRRTSAAASRRQRASRVPKDGSFLLPLPAPSGGPSSARPSALAGPSPSTGDSVAPSGRLHGEFRLPGEHSIELSTCACCAERD